MADILETMMLICFGCSWPLSVYKNIKARSAKAMSLQFILLIIAGYIAGITAKVLRGNFSYVLVMYVVNLLIVSVNVVVYFINRRYDRQAEKAAAAQQTAKATPFAQDAEAQYAAPAQELGHALQAFVQMDAVEPTGGVVMFGGVRFAEIAFTELAESSGLDEAVHNRSIAGLHLADAGQALEACVLALHPQKVFLNLGEADLGADLDALMEQYEWLLYTLHNHTRAKLYLASVMHRSPTAAAFNARLEKLAAENGCAYIDLMPALANENADVRAFELMRNDMRLHPITLTEVMQVADMCGTANAG